MNTNTPLPASGALAEVQRHLLDGKAATIAWLESYLRLQSVSADPAHGPDMAATRAFLVERLHAMGLADVQLLDAGGEAAVFGQWLGAPGRPTLLIYAHYDVQPPEPLALWRTPPFEPTTVGDRIYARGASDVKGATAIALAVVESFLRVHGGCPVNIKVFLEGEEETGSPSLRALALRHAALLRADAVLSADGGRASALVPTVNTGARGNAQLEVRLRTADKDLHSGRYGGAVRNALHEAARLVASLHRADGSVAVPGFFAGVRAPGERERADTAAFPYDEAAFFADVGALPHGEAGYSARERITLRPALDVNGLYGGHTGAGGKTIVPCEAVVKLTVRVVTGQDPAQVIHAVAEHLQALTPPGCSLEVTALHEGSPASTLAPEHPLVRAAETVLAQASGMRPIHVRLGASVPITSLFKETLGMDTLMFGYNLPDEDVHAPNEFFRLSSIHDGLMAWSSLLHELGHFSAADFPLATTPTQEI
ncbi:acetylornithine deacetylase/succinyl-diaminopimelate desuccinylase-like protein [Acidovorax soli]|uniref:Acetylornithine deacetylase/succinyl-diaminopimelate desuccinylase-like protein n=1 Tax=Acidovorax soli TaxID=592050 RepID=A0A7X0PHG4_9BURK|nr:M20/M25/M40 family metallo-hydrolase [Acidovorax soli]MBB6562047.1 acetylornithine deacetylase/succinyl-diaminopimelate desuccinylase-like protein [Acidovorax soli]